MFNLLNKQWPWSSNLFHFPLSCLSFIFEVPHPPASLIWERLLAPATRRERVRWNTDYYILPIILFSYDKSIWLLMEALTYVCSTSWIIQSFSSFLYELVCQLAKWLFCPWKSSQLFTRQFEFVGLAPHPHVKSEVRRFLIHTNIRTDNWIKITELVKVMHMDTGNHVDYWME